MAGQKELRFTEKCGEETLTEPSTTETNGFFENAWM